MSILMQHTFDFQFNAFWTYIDDECIYHIPDNTQQAFYDAIEKAFCPESGDIIFHIFLKNLQENVKFVIEEDMKSCFEEAIIYAQIILP